MLQTGFDVRKQADASFQVSRRRRPVRRMAEMAFVPCRNGRGDQLALAAGQRGGPSQQDFGEFTQGFGRLGPVIEQADDARQLRVLERDMGHEIF